LIVTIAGQEFALPIGPIVEIIRFRKPTPVPGAERGILGIMPLRGRMVTVIDGRRRLGLHEAEERSGSRVVVVRDGSELLGLVVDAVWRIVPASREDREPLPAALTIERPERFAGILRRNGGFALLLEPGILLSRGR